MVQEQALYFDSSCRTMPCCRVKQSLFIPKGLAFKKEKLFFGLLTSVAPKTDQRNH